MAPWPTSLMQCFQLNFNAEEDFYAPYNKLLCTLFPVDTPFIVVPRIYRTTDSGSSSSVSLEYTVLFVNKPVFVLQVKAPSRFRIISAREEADTQLRRRIRDLVSSAAIPTLHAVSAFGTRLCFYSIQEGSSIAPLSVIPDPDLLVETVPSDRWDCDLLDDDGAIRLKEVVNKIRNQCENL
ncbi:hypothetical protein BDZ94DRAFT_1248323 [Collybia nuda]|uniref:Uncharacterized protein n=1 Tax=Collybia nuda TaxID=64659 RepID=A0A9P6CIM0_9AGAR|nr:hypothetical protein BDZ94DRAFT_1248323 [Collybia nuda]